MSFPRFACSLRLPCLAAHCDCNVVDYPSILHRTQASFCKADEMRIMSGAKLALSCHAIVGAT
jgi:hypothetical protein